MGLALNCGVQASLELVALPLHHQPSKCWTELQQWSLFCFIKLSTVFQSGYGLVYCLVLWLCGRKWNSDSRVGRTVEGHLPGWRTVTGVSLFWCCSLWPVLMNTPFAHMAFTRQLCSDVCMFTSFAPLKVCPYGMLRDICVSGYKSFVTCTLCRYLLSLRRDF